MQDSSAFQYLAIDTIHPSKTNPRRTFDPVKLQELAASVREHGIMQPITVRPDTEGFEIVVGERRYLASQLAEKFSVPVHIKELTDTQAMEWQLIENAQREDVHPYEEAQGYQRLLDMPGYDVTALVEKSGKSASHIYARLSLLQLIPNVAQVFVEERITASHANLIARLPQEHQAAAFDQCWRKDWKDDDSHLLPAKHLAAWIETNLYLALAGAPFDREDTGLNPAAGACVACPRRSGYNTSLFADVQGDQCLDSACYQVKVDAHIERELAARPELVQIETSWRHPDQQRPGALLKNKYRELDIPDNPDAEPPCPHTHAALIVYGRRAGCSVMVCTEDECPVHNSLVAARIAKQQAEDPAPVMPPAPDEETEEEAEQRQAEHAQRQKEYEDDRQRREEERKAEFERQQKEFEAATKRREKQHKARLATLERIVEAAPLAFDAAQLRAFIEVLLLLTSYGAFEDVAEHVVGEGDEDSRADYEILCEALTQCTDEKLMGFLLRLVLTEHTANPMPDEPDWLIKAEAAFTAPKPDVAKTTIKKKPALVKQSVKSAATKQVAA